MTGTGKQMLTEKADINVTRGVMKVIVRGRNSGASEEQAYSNGLLIILTAAFVLTPPLPPSTG